MSVGYGPHISAESFIFKYYLYFVEGPLILVIQWQMQKSGTLQDERGKTCISLILIICLVLRVNHKSY